jgi:hypothetical protein
MPIVKCPTCKTRHEPCESIVTMDEKPDLHKNNSTMRLRVKCGHCKFDYYVNFETHKID